MTGDFAAEDAYIAALEDASGIAEVIQAHRLQRDLDQLERTDPDVAAAARGYDEMRDKIIAAGPCSECGALPGDATNCGTRPPAEAVEAAAKALNTLWSWEELTDKQRSYYVGRARAVLAAALPLIREHVADEYAELREEVERLRLFAYQTQRQRITVLNLMGNATIPLATQRRYVAVDDLEAALDVVARGGTDA